MTKSKPLASLAPISVKNRLLRALWHIVWLTLYRPTPVAAHKWRSLLLRTFGATIVSPAYPYPTARIWAPWNLEMRRASCLAADVDCYNVTEVSIGEGVTVSQKSYLCTASHDFDKPTFQLTGAPIVIDDGAWVAADAFVGPGVHIGSRAVVLARAVVVRDVEPETVVGGNPSRVIRHRASER